MKLTLMFVLAATVGFGAYLTTYEFTHNYEGSKLLGETVFGFIMAIVCAIYVANDLS